MESTALFLKITVKHIAAHCFQPWKFWHLSDSHCFHTSGGSENATFVKLMNELINMKVVQLSFAKQVWFILTAVGSVNSKHSVYIAHSLSQIYLVCW